MAREKNNKGFTLIELIIAIAVLVILTGILAPQIMKYIEKAKQAKVMHGFDEVCHAFETAWMDPDNKYSISVVGNAQFYINADLPLQDPEDIALENYASSYLKELFGSEADKYIGYIYFEDGQLVQQLWVYLPDGKPASQSSNANYYLYTYYIPDGDKKLDGPLYDNHWHWGGP